MEILAAKSFPITHLIRANECARFAGKLARQLEYSDGRVGEVEIVASEIAKNLARHAKDGTVVVQAIRQRDEPRLEFLAWDRGPGIENISAAMVDGYSTAGSLGHGMGAISRLSNELSIDSKIGQGTRLFARMLSRKEDRDAAAPQARRRLGICGVSIPKRDENANGDDWAALEDSESVKIVVIDGLGHGPKAAVASNAAIEIATKNPELPCDELLRQIHQGLIGTRGAVGAVAEIDLANRRIQFAGIGNVRALLASPEKRQHLISHNGTLGQQTRRIQLFEQPWTQGCQLIMHSDGLGQRWDVETHLQLMTRHPGLGIATLLSGYQKQTDDCTVVAVSEIPFAGRSTES